MILTESAVEAAATTGNFVPTTLQEANLGPEVMPVWRELDTKMGGQAARQAAVAKFNTENRWRKRGLWSFPVKYLRGNHEREMVQVSISSSSGRITVSASGIEMGQGLNTKVAQAVAMAFSQAFSPAVKVTIDMVENTEIKSTNDYTTASGVKISGTPNASGTSGSGTSEACVDATFKACAVMVARLKKYALPGLSWEAVVRAASAGGVDLATAVEGKHLSGGEYYIYAAGATEVELDVLTVSAPTVGLGCDSCRDLTVDRCCQGEYQILRADLVYDSGVALNPALDIGQLEGVSSPAALSARRFALSQLSQLF